MKKVSEQKNRPDMQYVRDWVREFESRHGECESTREIIRVIYYAENLEEEVDRRELYIEAFKRLLDE
jgi:hypothetical protein